MEKRTDKGVIIALSIVIVVLVGVITYMLVNDNKSLSNNGNVVEEKEENKDEENLETEDTNQEEDSKVIEEEIALEDLDNAIYRFLADDFNKEEFLKSEKTTNKTLNDEFKLYYMMKTNGIQMFNYNHKVTNEIHGTFSVYTASGDKIVAEVNKVFGKENGYKHITQSSAVPNLCASVSYKSSTEMYELEEQAGCGDARAYSIFYDIEKVIKKNDSIIVTEKAYVSGENGVFKDFKQTLKIADKYDENKSDSYFEHGATITYTFKMGDNGLYYFDNSKVTYK